MSEERQYFSEQARERLALLGIAPGPKQPLEEKDAEIARLRSQVEAKDAALRTAREWLALFLENYCETGGEQEVAQALETALAL